MSAPTPKRRIRTVLAAVAMTAVLATGCTAGDWRYDSPPAAGVQSDAGPVKVRNLMFVADESGDGVLLGSIAASEAVSLTSVSVAAEDNEGAFGEAVELDLSGDINRDGVLMLDADTARVEGAGLTLGRTGRVTLEFDDGTRLEMLAPVYSSEHPDYSEVLSGA